MARHWFGNRAPYFMPTNYFLMAGFCKNPQVAISNIGPTYLGLRFVLLLSFNKRINLKKMLSIRDVKDDYCSAQQPGIPSE